MKKLGTALKIDTKKNTEHSIEQLRLVWMKLNMFDI